MLSGIINSQDPDQTVPSGTVLSEYARFTYGILSETLVFEILGHLPYLPQPKGHNTQPVNFYRVCENTDVFGLTSVHIIHL